MKTVLPVLLFVLISCALNGQQRKYATFYYQRASLFEQLPIGKKDIVFLGNSITNGAEWFELFQNSRIKNRGISGDNSMGVYDRLDAITKGEPAKLFLLIGINDLSRGVSADSLIGNIELIIGKIKHDSPRTRLYLQSILPVTDHYGMFGGHTKHWQAIKPINAKLSELARKHGVVYVDLYTWFTAQGTEKMDTSLTNDGLHLMGKGYLKWVEIIKPLIEAR